MQDLRETVESILEDRREAERRSGFVSKHHVRRPGIVMEFAKIVFPAVLAFGGAWLSMHDQIADLKGDVKALSTSMDEVKRMLGIGVYDPARARR